MGKKHSKNWAEIQQDFNSMAEMSCIPSGIKKLRGDHVIDMDQSVRWNQKQVRLNNEKYQEEVKRLNREKNKRRDAIYEDITNILTILTRDFNASRNEFDSIV